jgi:hypothetical protein
MHCTTCGAAIPSGALFCPGCGRSLPAPRPVAAAAARTRSAPAIPREEAESALSTRYELGERMEPEVVDAFVDRVEQAIDTRIESKLTSLRKGGRLPVEKRSRGRHFIGRIAVSLGAGIPLTGLVIPITEVSPFVGSITALGIWASILTLNLYYTEVEKQQD